MNIKKGLKGIRKFLDTTAKKTGWHVTVDDEYIAYMVISAETIIRDYSKKGYTFIGWSGNGIAFTK